MGWGLALLAVVWIAMWLFGLNLVTIGLLLLCGGVLVLQPGSRTASRHHGYGRPNPGSGARNDGISTAMRRG